MAILRLPVGQMEANCYLLYDERTKEALVIDPGDEADFIISKLRDYDLLPKAVIATHGHFDHVGAVSEIVIAFSLPFMASKLEEPLLKKAQFSAKHFSGQVILPVSPIAVCLKDGDRIPIGSMQLIVIQTPGHTPGGICLYSGKERLLICGDIIFADGTVGRYDFYYSDKKVLDKSIKRLMNLPNGTVVYPGHGNEFNLGDWRVVARGD
ncbi:hypothetical protein A2115_00455 [Candidatus Woesebacteria bacterium GWA1_41_8]|uniref:Metallo-beta-lactamase domain-containing protein n=1 Tax=Candidatus Woesebacteria bacterium GWA1_41_8 TaxID=1802471 RepID=A0A1F7WGE0_9BACT|nr:MAG: hypothetical protein A2115_00455 [Candidatus Woesebacteria bacterium GWA1_41_8]